jgi:hypothetical protein
VADGAEYGPPRLFGTDAEARWIATGLLARDLPRAAWTHEAHLAAISVILLEHDDILPERDMPAIIAGYNVAVGGVNDDTQGYHETITQFWIAQARTFHRRTAGSLVMRVNRFIGAPEGQRDAPFRSYSRSRLFSVEARRRAVEPDLMRFETEIFRAAPAPQL